MESYLIISNDKKLAEEYIEKICQEKQINNLDITNIDGESSIGIAEARNLQKTLFLAPLRGKTKATIIKDAQKLTLEAQNALLKILEEPPLHAIFILIAEQKDLLLPTIQSRCKIIELSTTKKELQKDELSVFSSQFSVLLKSGVGYRLKLAETLAKDKNEALSWLKNTILATREQLTSIIQESKANRETNNITKQLGNTIVSLQKTYVTLKTTNTSPRLSLENLFLDL